MSKNNLNWRETDPNNPHKYKEDINLYTYQRHALRQLSNQYSMFIPRGSGRSRALEMLMSYWGLHDTNEGENRQ